MKRYISFLLAFLFFIGGTVQVNALEVVDDTVYSPILVTGEASPGGSFSLSDVQVSPVRSDEETYALYATRFFAFNDLNADNTMSDWVQYEVQQGDGVYVDITSCSWYPHTCELEVGILNMSGPDCMCTTLSGGDYRGQLVFGDVNAGNYIVYVRNLSAYTISYGSIRYSIS